MRFCAAVAWNQRLRLTLLRAFCIVVGVDFGGANSLMHMLGHPPSPRCVRFAGPLNIPQKEGDKSG